MGELVGLVVYDSVLFNRTGQVRRWADSVERRFTLNAIQEAPFNKRPNKGPTALPPGSLKASIHGSVTRVGPRHLQTDISADVPYALYVIEGTTGPITATSAPYMKLPSNPGYGTRTRLNVVSGQRANNFLGRAAAATALRHPSLRGFEAQVFEQF